MLAAVLVASLLTSPAATPASGATPAPVQIVAAALQRLQSYPIPPYVINTIAWDITTTPRTGGDKQEQKFGSRYAWRTGDGIENITSTPSNGILPPATIVPQFLGPFAWSLRTSGGAKASRVALQPDTEGLATIAVVTGRASPSYDVSLLGIETIEGHEAYHIVLRPRGNRDRHNLRDLWIDTTTSDIWKAHFVGYYYGSAADITTYLVTKAGYRVIAHDEWTFETVADTSNDNIADAQQPTFGAGPPASDSFIDAQTQLGDIIYLSKLPDWLFDASTYERHRSAGEPDIVGEILQRLAPHSAP